jgi:hypothetical protein
VNTSDFLAEVESNKVRTDAFNLQEAESEAYCLQVDGVRWTTFYFEKGRKVDLRSFDDQSTALEALLETLLADPATRI